MKIPMYQVDAFSSKIFGGNPAAVCVLQEWLDDAVLQNIAAENNLAETAFIIQTEDGYDLRWFTPTVEIDLCGHATLASAYVVFEFLQPKLQRVEFSSMSGKLIVEKTDTGKLSMDFPSRQVSKGQVSDLITKALGKRPVEVWESQDLVVVFDSEADIRSIQPDMEKLKLITDFFAVIITSRGDKLDFVSRFFAPNAGIPEDPVTGRAHCVLIPFWAERLNKSTLHAMQLSQRTGEVFCEDKGSRVAMMGDASLFLKGEIYI